MKLTLLMATWIATAGAAIPPTVADPDFDASVTNPRYAQDAGPRVAFDGAHQNFHRLTGRYKPAADVLRADGYRVHEHVEPFLDEALAQIDVLIVASAVGDMNPAVPEKWRRPVPSAFDDREIQVLLRWVHEGGGLLLVTDYTPVAGMSAKLAAAFNVYLADGYAYAANGTNKIQFAKAAGALAAHPILDNVASVSTFAGTAMLAPDHGHHLLVFESGAYLVEPEVLPPPDTPPPANAPRRPIAGWGQAIALEHGEGRVAIFGEAAVFSAQRYPNGSVMGMNHPEAGGNKTLLRNVVAWLAE